MSGFAAASQASRLSSRLLMLLMLKLAIFIGRRQAVILPVHVFTVSASVFR